MNSTNESELERAAQALEVVTAAIARGVIAPRSTTLKARWLELCEDDPTFIDLLNAAPGNPVLTSGRITSSTRPAY